MVAKLHFKNLYLTSELSETFHPLFKITKKTHTQVTLGEISQQFRKTENCMNKCLLQINEDISLAMLNVKHIYYR